jgi:hypothetical protein
MGTASLRLPDFIIAGAQKCGTTSLHRYLSAHPALYLPRRPQELHFFDFDENFSKGIDWFAEHFALAGPAQTVGQTSPLYLYDERVPSRLANALPRARLIFLLRDPVARAYSHYWHQVKKGTERLSFMEALAMERERLQGGYDARRQYSYVDRGRYAQQLARFARLFPRSQMLVLNTEALGARPLQTLARCFDFLGVDPLPADLVAELAAKRFNEARLPRWPALQQWIGSRRSRMPFVASVIDKVNLRPATTPPMPEEARAYLVDQLAEDCARLGREFDFDTSAWPSLRQTPHEAGLAVCTP